MSEHYDALETRDPAVREREELEQLRRQVAYAKAHAPAFARTLAAIEPADITSRAAFASVPVVRKSELAELQRADRPFGGLAAARWGEAKRVFASPGAIYEPEGSAPDYWRFARALFNPLRDFRKRLADVALDALRAEQHLVRIDLDEELFTGPIRHFGLGVKGVEIFRQRTDIALFDLLDGRFFQLFLNFVAGHLA